MQVKIFEAPDMAAGLKLIRKELGPDALILSTRTIRNGRLGILGKPLIEITAAIDQQPVATASATPSPSPPPLQRPAVHQAYRDQQPPQSTTVSAGPAPSLLSRLHRKPTRRHKPAADPDHETPPAAPPATDVSKEINELKSMVSALSGELSRLSAAGEQPPAADTENRIATEPDDRRQLRRDPLPACLLANDVDPEHAATLAAFARESLSFAELSRPEIYTGFLRETIGGLLSIAPPDFTNPDKQQRIALLGPTGVGKTTTLAKIAATYLGAHSPSVALITIDTYRIAAVEQLKVYGEIMRLPVEVVITPSQLAAALERHRDRDLVLIDTAGRSPRDDVSIEELATFLDPELAIDKHLVLSAATREKELFETIERFSRIGIDRTIYTKIDECRTLGVLLNMQIRNPAPISWLTNGQRVPEDLLTIDQDGLARLILPTGEGNNP